MTFTKSIMMTVLLTGCLCPVSFADTAARNATLARINTVLNQVNPLITVAQRQQDPQARVQFQFDALRDDIARIQSGITQALQRVTIQPRVVTSVKGDYLPAPHRAGKKETVRLHHGATL